MTKIEAKETKHSHWLGVHPALHCTEVDDALPLLHQTNQFQFDTVFPQSTLSLVQLTLCHGLHCFCVPGLLSSLARAATEYTARLSHG